MYRLFLSLLYVCIFNFSFSQKTERDVIKSIGFDEVVLLKNKDTITYTHTIISNSKKSKPTIIFVQGSLPLPLFFQDDSLNIGSIIPFNIKNYTDNYNFVIIARKGIPLIGQYNRDEKGYLDTNGNIPNSYIRNDYLEYRVFQLKNVVKDLIKKRGINKREIIIVGHSEGYRVVARFAKENRKMGSKFIFMSADPFNRDSEQVLRFRLSEFFGEIESEESREMINSILNEREIKLATINNSYTKQNSEFKNWYGYNYSLTYNDLRKIKKPSLIVYGTNDIASFNNDLLHFLLDKEIFDIIAFPNLDHNYFRQEYDENGNLKEKSYHWDKVFDTVIQWVEKN